MIFGKDCRIQTASFFASTLDIHNKVFLHDDELLFEGDSLATIHNHGELLAFDGDLIFIAAHIENDGSLQAPNGKITLAASQKALVQDSKIYLFIDDLKHPYSSVMNVEKSSYTLEETEHGLSIVSSGNYEAKSIEIAGEKIEINEAQLDAPSGEIHIHGDQISITADTSLSTNAGQMGDGGTILLLAKEVLDFGGKASAQGGTKGGNGGFVEISSQQGLFYHPATINTSAPLGKTGSLLIDPNDINIQTGSPTSGGFSNPYTGAGSNPALLNTVDLVGATGLLNNNVTVQTSVGTPGGSGDITVQDSFTWASGNTLTLVPSRDLNVNALVTATGTGGITVTAGRDLNVGMSTNTAASELRTDSGPIDITASNDVNVSGGNTANASARISSDSGTIQVTSSVDANLTGGSNTLCFAEIASALADITLSIGNFSSSFGNLTLTGGSGTQAYAQIGKGQIGTETAITSNITFSMMGNNVSLMGGSNTSAYAQIGHAPFGGAVGIPVTGNINFPNNLFTNRQIGGSVTLSGGTSDNTTAIIGHGNELSAFLSTITTNEMVIIAEEGITVTGGTGNRSHGVIGFHHPSAGSSVNFSCDCDSITLRNVISTGINITGGTGSNGVIGFYNNTNASGFTANIEITNLNLEASLTGGLSNNMTLQAGNQGGIGMGVAALGTLINTGTAQSAITIDTQELSILGPGGGNDGSARMINNLVGTAAAFDIIINGGNISLGDLLILGGTGTAAGFAEIYSSRDLDLRFRADLTINNSTQTGAGRLRANRDVLMNVQADVFFADTLSIVAGANSTAEALIQAQTGSVSFGTTTRSAGEHLVMGNTASMAPSRIVTSTGTSPLNFNLTTVLQAGSGAGANTRIESDSGTITFLSGTQLDLRGGSNTLCFAEIASTTGDVNISVDPGPLNLIAGSGTNAYAQIGRGSVSSTANITSDINLNTIGGGLNLTGGSGVGAYAQIGHSPFGAAVTTINANVNPPGAGVFNAIALTGGSNNNATAIIGHGNELTSSLTSITGDISVISDRLGLTISAGTATGTHAVIGFHTPNGGPTSPLTCTSNLVNVDAFQGGPLTLNASNNNNAVIGYYNQTNGVNVDVTIQSVEAQTSFTTLDSIILNSSGGAPNGGIAFIGTETNMGTSQSSINIQTGNLFLNGPTGTDDGAAIIRNNRFNVAAAFDVQVFTENTHVIGGAGSATGFAQIYSSRDLFLNARQDLNVNQNPNSPTVLQNGNGRITASRTCNINVPGSLGTLTLLGGSTTGMITQIDSLTENLHIGVSLSEFSGDGAIDLINGRSDMIGPTRILAPAGIINVHIGGSLVQTGGSNAAAIAEINALQSATIQARQDQIYQGGSVAGADSRVLVTNQNVFILAGGSLEMTGGSSTNAFIRTSGGTNGFINGHIGLDIVANFNSFIENLGDGDTQIQADRNIIMNSNSFMRNTGTGSLITFSGDDTLFHDTSRLETTSGDLTVVADNYFPDPPNIGSGSVITASTTNLTTTGGALRVFTSRQPFIDIKGTLNSFTFARGTQFVDTPQELWQTYYPNNFNGVPFTVFYKDPQFIPAVIIHEFTIAISEFLQTFSIYDEFFFYPVRISEIFEGGTSHEEIDELDYEDLREIHRNYNTKKLTVHVPRD